MSARFCPVCEKPMALETADFDYTRRAGLAPGRWQVVLKNIEILRCECGESPRIPNLKGLHYTIGLALISNPAPLDGNAVRFLRKTLGLTQEQFASEFGITPQYCH